MKLAKKLKLTFERDVIATQTFELDVEIVDTSNEPLGKPSTAISPNKRLEEIYKNGSIIDPIEFDDRCFESVEEAGLEWFELRADILTSEVEHMGEPGAGNEVRVYGLPKEEEGAGA